MPRPSNIEPLNYLNIESDVYCISSIIKLLKKKKDESKLLIKITDVKNEVALSYHCVSYISNFCDE